MVNSIVKGQKIGNQSEYYEHTFDDVDVRGNTVEKVIFENCRFIDCDFRETFFYQCKFVDCCFKSSNLSLIKLNNSSFNEVEFDACKLTGVNWTQVRWSSIALISPIYFKSCDISLSTFYQLKLPELSIIDCKAHDVDFRECDLTRADFTKTNLEKSQFMHTKLNEADFRDSINYIISPLENSLSRAKFSVPDVLNLLHAFNIEIE